VLLHSAGHIPLQLLAIPIVWSSIAGFSGWVLGMPGDPVMPLPAILALAAACNMRVRRRFRRGRYKTPPLRYGGVRYAPQYVH
jgi:hypothetical protein